MTTKQLPGTDILATLNVKDADGNELNLEELAGFSIYAYIKPNRIISQFAYPAATNYAEIEDDSNLSSGEIKIKIPGEKTKELSDNKIHLVMYARTDNTVPIIFGTTDGVSYELVYITSSPNPALP